MDILKSITPLLVLKWASVAFVVALYILTIIIVILAMVKF